MPISQFIPMETSWCVVNRLCYLVLDSGPRFNATQNMHEESRLSSSSSSSLQPSTSKNSSHSSSLRPAVCPGEQKASDARQRTKQQEQPSTSRTWKNELPEFGYTNPLPFAPWRRKRYGLTVQGLHEEIVDMYHWIKPNEIESRLRTKVFEKVRDSVLRRWKHKTIKISMFGSLRTNLFLPTSDIDVLVECDDWGGTPGDWLSETARGLESDSIAESVMVYGGAFVPIVKMVDRDTRLSIDISFNTVQGVRAASYIAKVKEEFPLLEPLVLLLKQFLHYRNLNQTFTGGLSSYGLVLLLVNFFQLYALNMRHRTIYDRGVNLGYLFLRFLEVYSLEFNYEEMGISPGQCCYIPKSAAGARYGVKQAQPGNLALEDPLLTANDVGRSTYNFTSIANAFGQAFQILLVAVTLRERKGMNKLATKVYKGSLLHMIMPFTSKELTYRNWLMSGVLSMPSQENSVNYDLNQIHNTLVSPMVDLSRYAWLRKPPSGAEKRDSRPLKIVDPANDVKSQVLLQLRKKILEETNENETTGKLSESEESSNKEGARAVTEVEAETVSGDTEEDSDKINHVDNDNGLILTGPPLPTSTASVNTSATVSTAASISEREDTDSPGLSSSLGTPSSEEEEDSGMSDIRKISKGGIVSVQFKKPFSEVVAQSKNKTAKEYSKRTQTNFDNRNLEDEINCRQPFLNELACHHYYQPTRVANFVDYATAAAPHKRPQRHRQNRKHSQESDVSDEYNHWISNNNNNIRGRRNGRAPSNSSNKSRNSSDSRSRGRLHNQAVFVIPPPADLLMEDPDITITGNAMNNSSLIMEEPRTPRMYADAVKKKSSVSTSTHFCAEPNTSIGNIVSKNCATQSPGVNNVFMERSYRNAVAIPALSTHLSNMPISSSHQHHVRKENECGFDTKSTIAVHTSELSHHQPQLVPPVVNRLQR